MKYNAFFILLQKYSMEKIITDLVYKQFAGKKKKI
jgi:hypothetical protein